MLKHFDNLIYALSEKGDKLCLIDMIPTKEELEEYDMCVSKRKFTVQCLSDWCEFLALQIQDFDTLKEEFPSVFDNLFDDSLEISRKLFSFKKWAKIDRDERLNAKFSHKIKRKT